MRNDLTALPWASGQLHIVENYCEAVGVLAALKAGISPESVRRPLADTIVSGGTESVSVDLGEKLDEASTDDSTRLIAKEEKSSLQ